MAVGKAGRLWYNDLGEGLNDAHVLGPNDMQTGNAAENTALDCANGNDSGRPMAILLQSGAPAQVGPLAWNEQTSNALALTVAGGYSTPQIALAVGMSPHMLKKVLAHPDFRQEVAKAVTKYRESAVECGLQQKAQRVQRLELRAEQIHQVIEERGASADEEQATAMNIHFDEVLGATPGGTTGIVVLEPKALPGPNGGFVRVDVARVDTELIKQELAVHNAIARELGQLSDKVEVGVTHKLYIGVPIDEI